jgi:hypothetical protein
MRLWAPKRQWNRVGESSTRHTAEVTTWGTPGDDVISQQNRRQTPCPRKNHWPQTNMSKWRHSQRSMDIFDKQHPAGTYLWFFTNWKCRCNNRVNAPKLLRTTSHFLWSVQSKESTVMLKIVQVGNPLLATDFPWATSHIIHHHHHHFRV